MKLSVSISVATIVGCLLIRPAMGQQSLEEPPDSSFTQLQKLLQSANHSHPTYSCDLRKVFNQCRQYAVFPGQGQPQPEAQVGDACMAMGGTVMMRIAQVQESCSSLGGTLIYSACPTENLMARCKAIKFRRDMTYDNSYYRGEPSHWDEEKLTHMCKHLPGQLELPNKVEPETPESPRP